METLANKLKSLRQQADLTVSQVSQRTDITERYLRYLESGRRTNPSAKVLHALATLYGVSVGQLMNGSNPGQKSSGISAGNLQEVARTMQVLGRETISTAELLQLLHKKP